MGLDVPIMRSAPFFPPFHHLNALNWLALPAVIFTKPNLQLPLIIVLLTVAMKSCWIMRISNWYIFRFRQAYTMSGSIKLWKKESM